MVTARATKPKTKEKEQAPTIDWLLEEATKLKEFWEPQKKRMEEDQKLYELFREEPGEGESNQVFNLPRVHVNKVARMISGAEWRPVFDPDETIPQQEQQVTPVERQDSATIKEQFILWAWEMADREAREGLTAGLKTTLTKHALVRGMVCVRVKPSADMDPDDPDVFPFEITAIDPINVYPRPAGKKIKHYLHAYKTLWGEVESEWGIEDPTKEADEEIEVISYYSETYWAVAAGGVFIKEPEEHGLPFNPLVVAVAEGGEFRNGPSTQGNQYVKFVGTGLLEDNRQAYKDRNRVGTLRDEMITRTINPAALTFTPEGKPIVVDLRSGALNNLDSTQKEDVKLLNPGAASTDLAKMETDLDRSLQLGAVPEVLYGSTDSPMSGYAVSLQSKGARDILTPWMDCLKGAIEGVDVRLLRMVADPNVGIPSQFNVRGNSAKLGRFKNRIAADQLGSDFNHEVDFGDVLPSDLPALIDMAGKAIGMNLLSRQGWLEQFGQSLTNDPKREFTRIMRENASLKASDAVAQLGIAALQLMLGEEGMREAFGNPQQAPAPAPGLSSSTLPPGEATGAPPPQIEPGSPEEAAIQQQMAGGIPPGL